MPDPAPALTFTEREFRAALGHFPTGVVVVTAQVGDTLLGSTISSFNSVSLDPPLILFSLAKSTQTTALWREAPRFGITVLAETQIDLSNRFARGGAEKWKGVAPLRSARGIPLVRDGVASFECEMFAVYEGGDHEIIVGRVVAFSQSGGRPLLFHAGRYGRLHHEADAGTPGDLDAWLHGW